MNLLKKYKTYRKISKELINKIINSCLDHDILMRSGILLNIVKEGTFVFDSENEADVLMDFALNEYKVNNKNTIKIYKEKILWRNEIEKDILHAFLSSYTSLFKIVSIDKAENTFLLSDILNKKDNIKIIDTGLSQSAIPGLLLFMRLVPFKDFNMTSGIAFGFPGNSEKYLVKMYKKMSKMLKSYSDPIKRFLSFHELNKIAGLKTKYK